jgi:hypothetical protein
VSANFVSGSSQYLTQASALVTTNGPFTVGFWVKINTLPGSDQEMCSISATSAQRTWEMYVKSTGAVGAGYYNGTAFGYVDTSGNAITAGVWCYYIFRSISTTNRRISVWRPGSIVAAQDTASFSAGALDRISLAMLQYNSGAPTAFCTCQLAEFFYADADVYPGGAAMDASLLSRIAFNGPLSVPHIVPMIVDYHPLRHPDIEADCYQRGGARAWTTGGAPTARDHPPLHGDYVRPRQVKRLLAV